MAVDPWRVDSPERHHDADHLHLAPRALAVRGALLLWAIIYTCDSKVLT